MLHYWLWFAVLALGAWTYFSIKRKLNYWVDRGVPGPPPLPIIGNMHQRLTADLYHMETEWVKQYGSVYGAHVGPFPSLFVTDPELLKLVLVKDFQHFINRGRPPVLHKQMESSLLFADDDQWRRIRTIISPSFTTGKLRGIGQMMNYSVEKLVTYLERLSTNADNVGVMDTKKVITGFTIDVIASTGFATSTDANSEDRSSDNQFVVMAKNLVNFPIARSFAMFTLPLPMLRWLGIDNFIAPEPFAYFQSVVKHILKERRGRKQEKGERHDLLQMMLDARVEESELNTINYENLTATEGKDSKNEIEKIPGTGKLKGLSEDEIIGNSIIFFIAGFETTSSTLSHCLFELAHHPDIQEQLHRDLIAAIDTLDDEHFEASYETIMNGIPLLDAIIKETLRLYPPISLIARICNTDGYRLGNVVLEKGTIVSIPTNAVHHDPLYHPEPYRFNPDRFMPQNRSKLAPYSFLPFAAGPRNCMGMRFAYQEIKLCLATIVRKFRFSLTPNTPAKLTFQKGNSLLVSNPFPIKVQKRLAFI